MGERAHRTKADPAAARVGLAVRRLRQAAGFTFDAFVEEVGLGRGYISELERGLVVPSLTALRRLAEVLGVTAADLVLGTSAREQLFEAARGLSEPELLGLLAEVRTRLSPPARTELKRVPTARAKAHAGLVPLVTLEVPTSGWSRPGKLAVDSYVRLPPKTQPKRGLFVARVAGQGLAPALPDGAYALFAKPWRSPLPGEVGLYVQGDGDEGRFMLRDSPPPELGPGRGGATKPSLLTRPFARFVRVVG